MKVLVEIKDKNEVDKIKRALGKKHVAIVQSPREKILDAIFRKFNVNLPVNYKFDREDAHAR